MFDFYRAIFLWCYLNNSDHSKCAEERKGELVGQSLGEISHISGDLSVWILLFNIVFLCADSGVSTGFRDKMKLIEEEGVAGNR